MVLVFQHTFATHLVHCLACRFIRRETVFLSVYSLLPYCHIHHIQHISSEPPPSPPFHLRRFLLTLRLTFHLHSESAIEAPITTTAIRRIIKPRFHSRKRSTTTITRPSIPRKALTWKHGVAPVLSSSEPTCIEAWGAVYWEIEVLALAGGHAGAVWIVLTWEGHCFVA